MKITLRILFHSMEEVQKHGTVLNDNTQWVALCMLNMGNQFTSEDVQAETGFTLKAVRKALIQLTGAGLMEFVSQEEQQND